MQRRKLKNWLSGLLSYAEQTEAPRVFWQWSGIFTLAAAMRRMTWLPYGMENIYPNLYVMLVAPPAARKGNPVKLARTFLQAIKVPVSVDSSSKRALTQDLVEVAKGQMFEYQGRPRPQAPLAIISPEMSSLLAVDPKGIIEILTDLYDAGDTWKYKTSGQGQDFIFGVCVSCLIATTPQWLSNNLPLEAIGGGYTSRNIIVSESVRYKSVPRPPPPDTKLFDALVHDLNCVATLKGQFVWGEGSEAFFDEWYETILSLVKEIPDERIHPFLGRIHVAVLKSAMALRVSYSDDLTLTVEDIGIAAAMLEEVARTASAAFGGHGRSRFGPETEKIRVQIKTMRKVSLVKLIQMNYMNVSKKELLDILETIESMGEVRSSYEGATTIYTWTGK